MKIGLFISTIKGRNTGNGGHYRSLLSYYAQLNLIADEVGLMHYNEKDFSILDDKAINLFKDIKNTKKFRKKASQVLKNDSWTAIISFGESLQSRLLRYYCWVNKIKYIQVIAGGPNRFLPLNFTNCIYYTPENLNNTRDFTPNKFLVSNRIDDYSLDYNLIDQLELKYPKKQFNILRVSRICESYLQTFISAINLHKFLKLKGINVQTHIVGHIQEKWVYDLILDHIGDLKDIEVIVDDKFTNDVKKIITYYNIAIGVGRGFGEAACKNLLVFGYNSLSELPVVINEDTYDSLRNANFSPRAKVSKTFEVKNFMKLFESNSEFFDEYKEFTNKKFKEDFSSSKLPWKLKSIISESKKDNIISIGISLFFISLSELGHRLDYYLIQKGIPFDIKKILFLK